MVKFYSEINPVKFGLVLAIIWAACLLLVSLVSLITKTYGLDFIYMIKSVYPRYDLDVIGILLGVVYSVIDGFVLGFLIAWIYNKFIR